MFGKLSFSVILVICMLQRVRTANNCKVSNEVVENPNLKCVPPLIEAEASPSTVCILPCKSNPIKFKFGAIGMVNGMLNLMDNFAMI